ncbi:MAG: hypothetical protein KAH13_03285, partial [Tenericutes bacterium]|nr:hypothetical protein [Mycoplasmatota bacterium]
NIAKYWMHNGRLSFKDIKMSKSLGNVIFAKDVSEKMALRYFLLSTHYRAPLNYSDDSFAMYITEWLKLENTLKTAFFKLDIDNKLIEETEIINDGINKVISNFNSSMDNDFNTANAITALQSLLRIANVSIRKNDDYSTLNQVYKGLIYMTEILGLKVELTPISNENRQIYLDWQKARKNKEFTEADKLRKVLTDRGVI